MNPADLAIILILLGSMLIGLLRGLVVELVSILIWCAALFVSWRFGPRLAGLFADQVEVSALRIFFGYGLVFVATLLIGGLLLFVLRRLIRGTGLSATDRGLGVLFGLARGLLVVVLLMLMVGLTPLSQQRWWRDSVALAALQPVAVKARSLLPPAVAQQIWLLPSLLPLTPAAISEPQIDP
ncbi:MAG: colicin V production CvpA [Lysobacterales bacterium CG02_land_8_20_14_3_00_62_12]|nr:MAG: colicin V production CvpA [Xanthomonadales bacterium CG02_land_8_20_14_3_00_62_12]PJA41801.1 MAG: colicin V production CvpA [Xanthomonadales bacterium CG_4_9_14_3_um_filter_62_6]